MLHNYVAVFYSVFQACWRGAAVRNSMRKVCRDYAEIFDEIEQKPSCSVEWHLGKHAIVGKPQFIPLDRRSCFMRLHAAKSKEPINSDIRLPLMQNCSDEDLQPVYFESDGTRTNLEVPNNEPATILVPQTDTNTNDVSQTDLPNGLIGQPEPEINVCNLNNNQNYDDISVHNAGRDDSDSTSVISSVRLQKNSQASSIAVPGNASLLVLFVMQDMWLVNSNLMWDWEF